MKAAGYLANKTPTKQLKWKTPFQKLQEVIGMPTLKLNIFHLVVYSCQAYPLNHNIPKKRKLEPQAAIEYLVSYELTNIFRIWIPKKKKVIVTRDITFDETKTYNSSEVTQAIDLPESMKLLLEVIEINLVLKPLAKDLETNSNLFDLVSDIEISFPKGSENL